MRRYLKLNLVGSSFWQLNNDNTYTKRNYESHEELLNNCEVYREISQSQMGLVEGKA